MKTASALAQVLAVQPGVSTSGEHSLPQLAVRQAIIDETGPVVDASSPLFTWPLQRRDTVKADTKPIRDNLAYAVDIDVGTLSHVSFC